REALIRAEKTLGSQKLQFRDDLRPLAASSFDVILYADLAMLPNDQKQMQSVLRLLSDSGHLIGGLRNPKGLALSGGAVRPKEIPPRDRVLSLLQPSFRSIEWVLQRAAVGYEMIIDTGDKATVDHTVAGPGEAGLW